MAWVRCENPGALPPFPRWEEVLATKIGDPRMMAGLDIMGDKIDDVTRSKIEYKGAPLSDVSLLIDDPKCNCCKFGLMPKLLRPLANSARTA